MTRSDGQIAPVAGAAKTKPCGPIPPYFSANARGVLMIGGVAADRLVEQAGDTPLFVYDAAITRARVAALRAALPADLAVQYAIKANSLPAWLDKVAPMVDGFDVASGGEMDRALAAGVGAEHISFAGPGKRDAELERAIAAGVTINLESAGEGERALAVAAARSIKPRLAVRVNPDFDLKGSGMRMGGGAKPFGVDAAAVPALIRRLIDAGADWRGLHIYAGSQSLDSEAIAEMQRATIALAGRLAEQVGAVPPLVNLGGGFGVPYFHGDQPCDLSHIGKALTDALAHAPPALSGARYAIELGRWLAAEAGVYLCRVVDRKVSHGEVFIVTDGGLHHQLAASGNFGTVIRRNYPIAIATKYARPTAEVASVVGCLCTPLDRLGDQVAVPHTDVGDLVAVFLAGAYGASASPAAFLGHPAARELVLDGDETIAS